MVAARSNSWAGTALADLLCSGTHDQTMNWLVAVVVAESYLLDLAVFLGYLLMNSY